MKKTNLLLFLIAIGFKLMAQNSNVVLFTENGERFQAVLNGVIQNAEPATNVKITALNAPNYKLKILFQDKALGEIDKNLYLEEYAENTFNIKKKADGQWNIKVLSITPLAEIVQAPVPNQNVAIYHSTPLPVSSTTTTTTTVTGSNPNGDNVNINMGVNGMGFNMNVNGNTSGTTTSQTTTTYSTTNSNVQIVEPLPTHTTIIVNEPAPNVYMMPGYSGPTGCPYPMSPQDFSGVKTSIMSKSFESTKFDIAKQVLGQRCMTAGQVKEMMTVFDFENTRLDFAKFAYGRTFDIGNYYQVNDSFTFESSITDLNNYISGYRR